MQGNKPFWPIVAMYVIKISLPYLCYINVDTPNTLNTTCIYQEHLPGCLVSVLINVTKLLMSNEATEVSYVSIKASECINNLIIIQ